MLITANDHLSVNILRSTDNNNISSYLFLFYPLFHSLNVRVILLIRDPRGSLQSRKHRVWCPGRPDCDHPPTVCNDMQADYEAAVELTKQYPNKFR